MRRFASIVLLWPSAVGAHVGTTVADCVMDSSAKQSLFFRHEADGSMNASYPATCERAGMQTKFSGSTAIITCSPRRSNELAVYRISLDFDSGLVEFSHIVGDDVTIMDRGTCIFREDE